ncbi:hypothetical protein K439DRAFT_1359495 [Ramaria rubella]|nr:hypothetical protein K439DRAFT_1359495 [Ramaria rubella]
MSTHILDHIVHLTPPGTVAQASAAFRKLGFDVLPGGTHADGQTYNALITLADGVYIELIAFTTDTDTETPTQPPPHRWASAHPGWIDYACLGLHPADGDVADIINARAAREGSGVVYAPSVDGGRDTDGKRVRWRLSAPGGEHGVGRLPFFCGDVTPRALRVPPPSTHPSTAQGISHIKLRAPSPSAYTTLRAQLTTVLGIPPDPNLAAGGASGTASASKNSTVWRLDTPALLPGLGARLILEEGAGAGGEKVKEGIYEVGFWVVRGDGGRAESPWGDIVWTPVP